jgi:ketosteroid isomerase-like protein
MGRDAVDVVRGLYEANARGDAEAFMAGLADEIEWHEAEGMPYGGVHRGREAIGQNVLGPLLTDIPDFALAAEEFIASGDTVAVVVRYTGTGKETGKELDLRVVHVWDVRDGQAIRFRQFADTVKFGEVVPADASVAG